MLQACAICCMLLSIWGVIQLAIMGVLFKMESVLLIEEASAHEYDNYEDFLKKTSDNYQKIAVNCWIAAGAYVAIIVLTCMCLGKAKRDAKIQQAINEDDNLACGITDFKESLMEKTPSPQKKAKVKEATDQKKAADQKKQK